MPRADMKQRSSPNGALSISCWISVGSLISGTAAAGACAGAVVMSQSVEPGFDISARTAPGHRSGLTRLGVIAEKAAVATTLQSQKASHVKLLEYAIRWEGLRAGWFSTTQQWDEVQACHIRQHSLEERLNQARIDAEIVAEERPSS